MEELFISFWCVDFEKCPSHIYYFEPYDYLGHPICKVNWVNFEINLVLYLIL
jgi:uncharacterized protein with PQ loop repeat